MSLPPRQIPYCYKDLLDIVIENTANQSGELAQADINKVIVAAIKM